MMAVGDNSRRAAAFAVARWMATGEFPENLLPDGADRAFVQDLVYVAVRRLRALKHVLGGFLKRWPKGEMEALLYVGAAQMLYMDGVPDFAAVNETVAAARLCPNPSVARTVNAVLRNIARNREKIAADLAAAPLAVRESYPDALVRRWTARYGADGAERMAAWHNTPAETFLARRDGTFAKLGRGERVADAPGYAEGDFIVQDPATAIAVRLLDPKPGERILDACAAPGGKTVQIAWRGADVTACEVKKGRRARLEENIARTGVKVRVVASFAEAGGGFDKVLVDAPCSNTGVLRRRPDARWGFCAEKLANLAELQSRILDGAAELVAPGGVLVYSTCSNEPEENAEQVEAFLARRRGFAAVASEESVPFESGMDGAFAAVLRRTPSV